MKKSYTMPDFDLATYDLDDVITISVGTGPVEGGGDGWIEV